MSMNDIPGGPLDQWSDWAPFSEAARSAPLGPGVYQLRLPASAEIVYVGMAGESSGRGIRGRLAVYRSGKGATSGFGEAALDRALADEKLVETQLVRLRQEGPRRARAWAQEAISWLGPEVRWVVTENGMLARVLEEQLVAALRPSVWNRSQDDRVPEQRI